MIPSSPTYSTPTERFTGYCTQCGRHCTEHCERRGVLFCYSDSECEFEGERRPLVADADVPELLYDRDAWEMDQRLGG